MSRTQSGEFVSALERGGLTVADGQKVIGNKDNLLAQSIVDLIRGQGSTTSGSQFLTSAGFTRQELQLENLQVWNQSWVMQGGFYRDNQIRAAMVTSPFYSWEEPSAPVVLCWTANDLVQTTRQSVGALRQVYGHKLEISPEFRIDTEHLAPVEGAPEFQPNRLWWEVLDVDANRNKACDAVPPATAGGIQVIQAAAHHPDYTRRMNGDDVAYWDVPGLRLKVPGRSEPCAPYVYAGIINRLRLGVGWASNAGSDYAGVVVRR